MDNKKEGYINERLKYAVNHGIIDLESLETMIEMKKRNIFLDKHKNKIWKGENGYWYTYLPDKTGKSVLRKKRDRADLEEEIMFFYQSEKENPSLDEVFLEWNDNRKRMGRVSLATLQRDERLYMRHYGEFGKYKIKDLDRIDFIDFLENEVVDKSLTSKAFSNLKSLTKSMLKRAKRRGYVCFNVEEMLCDLDVADRCFRKTIKEDYEEVFDDKERELVLEYLDNNLDQTNLAIYLMFVTGLRVGEVVALKNEDIASNCVNVRRTETRYLEADGRSVYDVKDFPKTAAGVRTVVLPDRYKWILKKIKGLNAFGEYVFSQKNGQRMTTNCVRSRLKTILKKQGIYSKSPHKIRKTYASILLDNGTDARMVTDQMGHADIRCTESYYHRNRKTLETKSHILSQIPEFQAK